MSDSKEKENNIRNNPIVIRSLVQSQMNHVYFYSGVSVESVNELRNTLKIIENHHLGFNTNLGTNIRVTPNPIILHIHSYGGSVYAGIQAINAIEECSIPVITVIDGIAASAATWLSLAGDQCYITKYGHMLIHELSTMQGGRIKWSHVEEEYKDLKELMDIIMDIYRKRTSLKSKKILSKLMQKDLYWNAEETCKNIGPRMKILQN